MRNYLRYPWCRAACAGLALLASACSDAENSDSSAAPAGDPVVFDVANGCFVVEGSSGRLVATADGFGFAPEAPGVPLFWKPSGLGRYLLYDEDGGYVVSDGRALERAVELVSDIQLLDDTFESEAEWELESSREGVRLRHQRSGGYLGADGAVGGDPVELELHAETGCADFPEDDTYSEGRVARTEFEDGSLFGFVDAHSHILANFGFGGGGIFHGAPFHPLGIEHALMSCERFHGVEGRKDLFGAGFDAGAAGSGFAVESFVGALASGELTEPNHATDGWPEFTEWPSAPFSSTHQTQYYKWIERAYLGGLRLIVQHAVSNQIICDLLGNGGFQPIRYSCDDMVAVDRQLEEIYEMQDYIDAQEGGPGEGWFRIVTSPEQAREVIASGRLAVILGIETSNLFGCDLVPPGGGARCTEADVIESLDAYHARGVRVLFPVHKYDNAFSAGDGNKGIIELGNVIQTGHFSAYTTDCDESVPSTFDRGPATFPGLILPRDDYFAPPPNDFSEFFLDPIATLGGFADRLFAPADPSIANHCQVHGMTPLGEFLIEQMMARGMVIETDHLPRKSYKRAFEILEENDYPAAGTHGLDYHGRLYALGGIATSGFGVCRREGEQSTVDDGFQSRVRTIVESGGFPALGLGLDLNGFAGARGPRFGPRSRCGAPQSDPLEYPFTSFAGDVTFSQPRLGNRTLDFNMEGLVHIGLLPEVIEDVRGDGVTDEELEPFFKSAEGYIRMWEKAERRGTALRGSSD